LGWGNFNLPIFFKILRNLLFNLKGVILKQIFIWKVNFPLTQGKFKRVWALKKKEGWNLPFKVNFFFLKKWKRGG